MASTHDTSHGDFDERLAEALTSTLMLGEEAVAQEVGDQGQAIVLTDSRILLLKAGLAATGELNGCKTSAFGLKDVVEVNLRKGPLGAVIQIVAQEPEAAAEGGRPDNVIVFTGPGRVRKAEAFVATIESAAGKTVNRSEPQARPDSGSETDVHSEPASKRPDIVEAAQEKREMETPKAGRVKKSLAEEIYSEVVQAGATEKAEPESEAPAVEAQAEIKAEPEPVVDVFEEEEEEESVQLGGYNPNPRLPRPTRNRVEGPNRMLVALGVLAALVFVGMAVMAPLQETSNAPVNLVANGGTLDVRRVKLQLAAVSMYRDDVASMLAKADAEAASFASAVRSGNKSSILSCSRLGATDTAWQELSDLATPPGLAEAKQNLIDGLVGRKNAISAAAASADAGSSIDVQGAMSRLERADAQIKNGLSAISAARATLQAQIEKMSASAKGGKVGK